MKSKIPRSELQEVAPTLPHFPLPHFKILTAIPRPILPPRSTPAIIKDGPSGNGNLAASFSSISIPRPGFFLSIHITIFSFRTSWEYGFCIFREDIAFVYTKVITAQFQRELSCGLPEVITGPCHAVFHQSTHLRPGPFSPGSNLQFAKYEFV